MNRETFTDELKDLYNKLVALLVSKGEDYANVDVLSNFKTAGDITGVGAAKTCLTMISIKVARLGVLLDGKEPNNESVEDSIKDLINYGILLYMINLEESHGSASKTHMP